MGGNGNSASLIAVNSEDDSNEPTNWIESIIEGETSGRQISVLNKEGCDWAVSVVINNTVAEEQEWQMRASRLKDEGKTSITIKYWIEDTYGEIVREPTKT